MSPVETSADRSNSSCGEHQRTVWAIVIHMDVDVSRVGLLDDHSRLTLAALGRMTCDGCLGRQDGAPITLMLLRSMLDRMGVAVYAGSTRCSEVSL